VELFEMTAGEAVEAIKGKKIKARELTEAILARSGEIDDGIKAFATVTAEKALEQADAVDRDISGQGDPLSLAGLPIVLGDDICLEGVPAAAGSRVIASFPAPYTATVVQKSLEAGAVVIGKASMTEFGMGSTGGESLHPHSRNPLNTSYSAGDGSAAAVASGQAMLGLTSDSGGSARISASYCGIAGFRPTPGSISRYGLISSASSMSQISFVARKAADFKLLFDPLFGFDPRDSSTVFADEQIPGEEGTVTRIGFPGQLFDGAGEPEQASFRRIFDGIVSRGVEVVEVSLPHFAPALLAYHVITIAESFSNLSRYDGIRYGFNADSGDLEEWYRQTRDRGIGEEAKRRFILGAFLLGRDNHEKYYEQALRVWTLVKKDFTEALHGCDLILLPVVRSAAPLLNEKKPFIENYCREEFCAPVSMAGMPSVSIPARAIGGMPQGIQLVGKSAADCLLIDFAADLEKEIGSWKEN
jgi:aspartyl-tRNA(Asn)/glutamyl-tRNA(Gln) amidotransferase subunit A